MTRSYGPKKRTQADRRAAALQFVIMADKPDAEKVRSLVTSYGMTQPEAEFFVAENGG